MRKCILFLMVFILPCLAIASVNDTADSINATFNNLTNETPHSINISAFFPKTFNIGDSQINIQIQNVGNTTLNNLVALVSGRGFSTYDIVPIESLDAGDKSYVIITGNFRESGNIMLTIKIMQETFYQTVKVINQNVINESEQDRLKREKIEMLNTLNVQLSELEKNYTSLENEIFAKKNDNHDTSQVSLADLKSYIRNAESGILSGNVDSSKVNFQLALEEYSYQKNKLDNAPAISSVDVIKSYALIFTTLAGAFIMIFTLYELLKKKGENVVHTIGSVKGKFRKTEDETGKIK